MGTKIYWESHGEGEPVLLIMGLSFTLDLWHRVTPQLARAYRVVLFDNRGVGRSDVPRGPYRIRSMAKDALAVMDAAGMQSAHVIGASMGGMIAQELALRWPERVQSLLLGCTSCGGLRSERPEWSGFPGLRRWRRMSNEERARAMVPMLYSEATPRELIEEDLCVRLRNYPSSKGVLAQALGIPLWSSYRRLPHLKPPTLVVHGDRDRILPPKNARRLAARIPGAEVKIVKGAGHMLTTDRTDECLAIIFEFLRRNGNNGNGH